MTSATSRGRGAAGLRGLRAELVALSEMHGCQGPRPRGSLLFLRNPRAAPAARLERGALGSSQLLRARAARVGRRCVFCPVTFCTL